MAVVAGDVGGRIDPHLIEEDLVEEGEPLQGQQVADVGRVVQEELEAVLGELANEFQQAGAAHAQDVRERGGSRRLYSPSAPPRNGSL